MNLRLYSKLNNYSLNKDKLIVDSGLECIVLRNDFYFTNYRRLAVINILLFISILLLIFLSYYQHVTRSKPYYFPTNEIGKPISTPTLLTPHMNDEEILTWVKNIISKIHSFDFINYRRAIQDLRNIFTASGHSKYMKAIQDSNNLNTVKKFKQVVNSSLAGEPIIDAKGILGGQVFGWRIKFPMQIVYQNADKILNDSIVEVTILLIRVSTLETANGLAIQQILW